MGEDERGWVTIGKLNIIMDDMIAERHCKPILIVVSTGDIGAMFNPRQGEYVNEARKCFGVNFTPALLNEFIPYVEKHFGFSRTEITRRWRVFHGVVIKRYGSC